MMLKLCEICRAAITQGGAKIRHQRGAPAFSQHGGHSVGLYRGGMTSPFTRKTLAFLRALQRNNDREWFRARKDEYEQHVRGPMIDLLGRLAQDFARFAPELVSDPRVSLYRIYRDTRFSHDKTPLKTHVAAHFPSRGFPRGEGAGLYLEIAPKWVWMGGGLYMPSPADLQAIRAHIAETHPTAAPDRADAHVRQGGWRARRRPAHARPARIREGSPGG